MPAFLACTQQLTRASCAGDGQDGQSAGARHAGPGRLRKPKKQFVDVPPPQAPSGTPADAPPQQEAEPAVSSSRFLLTGGGSGVGARKHSGKLASFARQHSARLCLMLVLDGGSEVTATWNRNHLRAQLPNGGFAGKPPTWSELLQAQPPVADAAPPPAQPAAKAQQIIVFLDVECEGRNGRSQRITEMAAAAKVLTVEGA
jgi:hypothetical protein